MNNCAVFNPKKSLLLLLVSTVSWLGASVPSLAQTLPNGLLRPTEMTTTIPTGSRNTVLNRDGSSSRPFVDDALLSSITFGGTRLEAENSQFAAVGNVRVLSERESVNAEFGDEDTAADGNANPFVKAGLVSPENPLSDALREGTNPATQDAAIRAGFSSLSLVEGVDGESADYTMRLMFQQGISDNLLSAFDSTPELIFFERGANSDFSLRLITGGTFDTPTYASQSVYVDRSNMWRSGRYIDTIEIGGGQELGIVGIDLSAFFTASEQTSLTNVTGYGVEITSRNNSGADLYGNFLSAANTRQFKDVPTELRGNGFIASPNNVPEPGTLTLLLSGALGTLISVRRKP